MQKSYWDSRNKFLFITMFIFILVLVGCSTDAESGSGDEENDGAEVNLDLSHVWPPSHHVEEFVQEFIDEVEEVTEGRVKITSYPGASLAAPEDQYDALVSGAVDIVVSVHSYTPNEFPLSSVMELPQMAEDAKEGSKILWDLTNEFEQFDLEYDGAVPLWTFTSDPGQIYTTDKPIKSIDDLKGLKIRSPSALTNKWLEALGATPVSMPMNDNFEALERGVVDGTIAPWEAVKAWGLNEVINYATVGNFYMTSFYAVINEEVWQSISEEDREAIQGLIGEETSVLAGGSFDDVGEEAVNEALEKGIEIIELSGNELVDWNEKIHPVIEEWIEEINEKGLPGDELYERAKELQSSNES